MADDMSKPKCKYGESCYQKNEAHLNRFSHPSKPDTSNNDDSCDHDSNYQRSEKRGKL